MSLANGRSPGPGRYHAVAMGLHWLIAALLIGNIAIAWWFNTLVGLAKIAPTQLHKSISITALLLGVPRLGWRLIHPPPPPPASVNGWERVAAGIVHLLFYVVMLGMPLTGWAMTPASRLIESSPATPTATSPCRAPPSWRPPGFRGRPSPHLRSPPLAGVATGRSARSPFAG